jgi:superoxide dismutase, Fe-Mn family
MTIHHTKHHQTYVTNLNAALATLATLNAPTDIPAHIALQQAIKFNGGGHINHSLFWENLTPANSPGASPNAGPQVRKAIKDRWGNEEAFKDAFSKVLLGLQGSGWGWLVTDEDSGALEIITTKDQDPVPAGKVPIFGVDMWEHAYYLQVCPVHHSPNKPYLNPLTLYSPSLCRY